jgi:L-lactate dehydrogenase complex protein LldF
VYDIIRKKDVRKIVKSKSMLTEGMPPQRISGVAHGIDVVDTDLGERIVPVWRTNLLAHIVLPCIHWKKEEIGELFHKHLGTPQGKCRPSIPNRCGPTHLRQRFYDESVLPIPVSILPSPKPVK